jgi:LPXTG-motif cell wall-anchored protein
MKPKATILLLLTLGFASWAVGQTGGKYSAAPTDQDYRLTIVEPTEGATITGKDLTIVLGQPAVPKGQPPAQSTSEPKERAMNTPTFQIWVDGKDYGNVPIGQNVFAVRDLSYGPHQIVVAAKNVAGELVDRKEISITTVEGMAGSAPPASPPTTAEAPERAVPPAPPAPQAAPPSEREVEYTPESERLPATGTGYPLVALVGLGLLGAGVALRRKV